MNNINWFLRTRIRTRQLLLLEALSEHGNINRAAEALGMSQPAASKLIRELEEALEVSLFERHSKGMRPTSYGETMIRYACAALTNLNHAHKELIAAKEGQFGKINIGAITAAGHTILPSTIAQILETNPLLRFNIQIEPSNVLIEQLLKGKLDIVIGRAPTDYDKEILQYEPLFNETISIITGAQHPVLESDPIDLAILVKYGWIIPPNGSALRNQFDLLLREFDIQSPAYVIESSSFLFTLEMIQKSDMVALLARNVAKNLARYGIVKIIPLQVPIEMERYGIITINNRPLNSAAKTFYDSLRKISILTN